MYQGKLPFLFLTVSFGPETFPDLPICIKQSLTSTQIAIFFNSLGGAIAISIAQNIFTNGLTTNLPKTAPDVNPKVVINAGASYLRRVVTPEQLPGVLLAYMDGLKQAFIISIACGGIGTICACFVEWKSVKGKKLAPVAA
jgi:hypothetical protein